jgi:hypothetical protein
MDDVWPNLPTTYEVAVGQTEVAAEAAKEATRYWMETLLRTSRNSGFRLRITPVRPYVTVKVLEIDPKEARASRRTQRKSHRALR